jgi:hypothetical protein
MARNDDHHDGHDRNSDNAIENSTPNQHPDWIYWGIPESKADHGGGGNDPVKTHGIRRFSFQGGGPAECLGNPIRSRAGKHWYREQSRADDAERK